MTYSFIKKPLGELSVTVEVISIKYNTYGNIDYLSKKQNAERKIDVIFGIFNGSYYAGLYATAHYTRLALISVTPATCCDFFIIFSASNQ